MVRVIIYKSPTEWVIKEIGKEHLDKLRQKLTEEGYYFVFTETATEDSTNN